MLISDRSLVGSRFRGEKKEGVGVGGEKIKCSRARAECRWDGFSIDTKRRKDVCVFSDIDREEQSFLVVSEVLNQPGCVDTFVIPVVKTSRSGVQIQQVPR